MYPQGTLDDKNESGNVIQDIYSKVGGSENLSILGLFIAVIIFNLLRMGDIKKYVLKFPVIFSFRSQLVYNVSKFFGRSTNASFNFNFGTVDLGNIYFLILLVIILIPLILIASIFITINNPNLRLSKFIKKKTKVTLLFFTLAELLITMNISTSLPIGNLFKDAFDFLNTNFSVPLNFISYVIKGIISDIVNIMNLFPPIVLIFILAIFVYYYSKKNGILTLSVVILFAIVNSIAADFWTLLLQTIAIIVVAAFFCILTGVPLGILSAKSDTIYSLIRPILDFMQTLPPFVYLIPVLFMFGIGDSAGILATYIFAMPPAVRLTNLGIRQVPIELIEVSDSYGCTSWQKLVKVELPVAFPTIMAGVNQVIMLALSMVVIAALIGSGGFGIPVVRALGSNNIKLGFNAGIAIVFLAIILDRVTGSRQQD